MTAENQRRTALNGLRETTRPGHLPANAGAYSDYFVVHGYHSIFDLQGPETVRAKFWRPLQAAFPDVDRRADICVSARFRETGRVVATGHQTGTTAANCLDIPANDRLTHPLFLEMTRLGILRQR